MKQTIKKLCRRMGIDISRYRGEIVRNDALFSHWTRKVAAQGKVSTVFDVGANEGNATAKFRSAFPDAHIHAFEPFVDACDRLRKKTGDDPLVTPHCMALGDEDREAVLYRNNADVTNSLLPNAIESSLYSPASWIVPVGEDKVPVQRIDTFCDAHGIAQIDVLKVDTQGFDGAVLKGCGSMLAPERIRALMLEVLFVDLYQNQSWCDELFHRMRVSGYKLFALNEIEFDQQTGWKWADALFIPRQS